MTQPLDSTRQGPIVIWRLAQPPLNEIGTEMLSALEAALADVEASDARALVIHSGMTGGFCAGADLRALHEGLQARTAEAARADLAGFLDRIHSVMDRLDMLPITTVGALHGVCFGGGFELALTLDLLVADVTTRFCFPELRLGIVPGFGGIPRLARELPNAAIRDLIMTGRSISAKKAAGLGLCSHLVGAGQALSVACEMAAQAALHDPRAVAEAKRFIKAVPQAELAREKALFLSLVSRPEALEALRRFVESEDPMPYVASE